MQKKLFPIIAGIFLLSSCAGTPEQLREKNLVFDFPGTGAETGTAKSISSSGKAGKKTVVSFHKPMTLVDTINYALEHNLDAAIAEREAAVRREALTGAYWRMLPSLMLSGESSRQNHYVPGSSMSWESRNQSLEPSVSHDKKTTTLAAELSWDMLNLAVDFQRMQQEKNQLHISEYSLRRVKQDLVLDVIKSYLNCAIARQAMAQARQLIDQAEQRQQVLERQGAKAISNPRDVLNGKISIYQLQDNLRVYELEASRQWQQLANLLGISPHQKLVLAPLEIPDRVAALEISGTRLRSLEQEALRQRPEMFRFDLEEEDAITDANIALTRILPSLTPFARYSYDDNSYLSRDNWANVGLRLSWDLFTIPRLLSEKKQRDQEAELIRKRRQAQALAVIVQLNLALAEYRDAREGLAIARKLEHANRELKAIMYAWADTVLARARIYNSLGRDFSPRAMDISRGLAPAAGPLR